MPAVFVHGVPDTARVWRPLLDRLERKDAVVLSLPGFDAPEPPGFEATKEAYADWLVAELEALDAPRDLVGHDWGAILVLRAASLRPDLVRCWVAGDGPIDSRYVWHETAQVWQTPEAGEQLMATMTEPMLAEGLMAAGVPEAYARKAARSVDETMKRCILKLYRSAVDVGNEWEPGLAQISSPGLLLWGANDPYAGIESARRMAAHTGARLVELDGCGHWWQLERPDDAAREIRRFWQQVEGG